jgi:hypothetical protein
MALDFSVERLIRSDGTLLISDEYGEVHKPGDIISDGEFLVTYANSDAKRELLDQPFVVVRQASPEEYIEYLRESGWPLLKEATESVRRDRATYWVVRTD